MTIQKAAQELVDRSARVLSATTVSAAKKKPAKKASKKAPKKNAAGRCPKGFRANKAGKCVAKPAPKKKSATKSLTERLNSFSARVVSGKYDAQLPDEVWERAEANLDAGAAQIETLQKGVLSGSFTREEVIATVTKSLLDKNTGHEDVVALALTLRSRL